MSYFLQTCQVKKTWLSEFVQLFPVLQLYTQSLEVMARSVKMVKVDIPKINPKCLWIENQLVFFYQNKTMGQR